MRFQTIFLLAVLVSLLALVPGSAYGQSQSPAATPQTSDTSAPPPPPQAPAAPLANAKPGKVWTNDEIDTLRNNHGVSVVGGNGKPQNVSTASKGYSQEKDPAWYRNQLASLRADIDKLDPQIAKPQAFLSGQNVSEPPTMHERLVPSPQDQLKQLEAKRQADAAKIEDLLDRARHNGIEPGALR
jgi:hypothetical protein